MKPDETVKQQSTSKTTCMLRKYHIVYISHWIRYDWQRPQICETLASEMQLDKLEGLVRVASNCELQKLQVQFVHNM